KYLAIRDREALLRYEDLKAENARSHAAKTFERPRKPERPNRRLRIWINLLIIAMVLAVLFFSVITPRLTPTHGDAVQESDSEPPLREPLP
ncbi:MAG: hypothetical protein KC931_09625, partial [Candidatus Omnitrophica bacterium]|nr:hypothetical protein [Candidatus Omnitrophota bacterium]